ncbi:MAG: glutamate--tRNA ligase [Chloroflexi bacterium]|nr:glutamate--tRNA ligase [Chloroflexota bacterium]
MDMVPRFRFAPSPTGTPHIGNLHTALFSWALARALGGDFVLRLEETDPDRNTPAAAQAMLDALTWLGIDWDEGPDIGGDFGPYVQSARLSRHQEIAAQLLAADLAYYGDDPNQPANPPTNLPLRLRLPRSGETVVNDALRGPITFDNSLLADPVLVRSNGRPLYHLAAMTDDHDMGITHVVRGEEWIASAPIHVQLYRALGWVEPVWIHLPLILNNRGQKLSKRDPEGGYLVNDFQDAGYLPEALFNYLLLLGWSPDGEQELVDKWDVRKQFRLERLSTSPAVFAWDKLKWVNRQYLQRLSDGQLADLIRPFLEDAYGDMPMSADWLVKVTAVIRPDIAKLEDAVDLAEWAFVDDFPYSRSARFALTTAPASPVILRLITQLAALVILDQPTAESILQQMRADLQAAKGWRAPDVFHPIRAALTGHTEGRPLPEIMGILGKERTMQRLARALKSG